VDDQGVSGAAQAAGDREFQARLPQLREPMGWRSLDERELAVRTALLLDAAMADPSARHTCIPSGAVQAQTHTPGPEAADAPAAEAPPSADADAARRWGRLALGLPWLVGVGGLAMSVPVLVWAPLLGGLCLGLVGLQVALARGWIHRRQALQSEQALPPAAHSPAAAAARNTPPGLLLAAFLAVFGLLASLVLYTAALKSREPASVAEIIRAQHQAARAEQGQGGKDVPEPTRKSPR
jgi:hypothetical protein